MFVSFCMFMRLYLFLYVWVFLFFLPIAVFFVCVYEIVGVSSWYICACLIVFMCYLCVRLSVCNCMLLWVRCRVCVCVALKACFWCNNRIKNKRKHIYTLYNAQTHVNNMTYTQWHIHIYTVLHTCTHTLNHLKHNTIHTLTYTCNHYHTRWYI